MSICLNMIVKNETPCLERSLGSVLPHIDCWAISDTGSTDGTVEFIRNFLSSKPGVIHVNDWVNFSHNRNLALQQAYALRKYTDFDHIQFMDADDEMICNDPDWKQHLQPTVTYDMHKLNNSLKYRVPWLISAHQKWEWRAPVHEYLYTDDPFTRAHIDDPYIQLHMGDGARSQVGQEAKFLGDAEIFERELLEKPNCTRSMFYLAQSYRDAGHKDKAYDRYLARYRMGGWIQEQYVSLIQASKIKPHPNTLANAIRLIPERVEGHFYLAEYYWSMGDHDKAYESALTAAKCNPVEGLFIESDIYSWRASDLLGYVAWYVGEKYLSEQSIKRALKKAPVSQHVRLAKNLGYHAS